MSPRRKGHLSYETVKASIERRIAAGGWQPGVRLPSERELVDEFGCARMTVHRALRELEAAGLVERRQGSGTYVAALHPIANGLTLRDIEDEIAALGGRHTAQVCGATREKADTELAAAMRLRRGAAVFRCRLLHLADGVPVQYEDRHVNAALVPHLLERDFTRESVAAVLRGQAPLTESEQVVEAVLATPEHATLLGVPVGSALLLVSRRTISQGLVASVARLYHPGGRFRLCGRFAVGAGAARAA